MGTPSPEHVSKGLMGDDDPGEYFSSGCFGVEIMNEREDEPRYFGEKRSVVTEIWPESLRNGKDELSMWQVQKYFLCQMLCEQEGPLLTA